MVKFLLFFLLVAQVATARKLVIDTIDPETGKVVKETEWIRLRSEDRNVMDIKIKRVGSEVYFYYIASCKNTEKCSSGRYTFSLTLANNETITLGSTISITAASKASDKKHVSKPTDAPYGIGTPLLSQADLAQLKNNDIERIEFCLFGDRHTMVLKKKDQDAIKEYAALVM